MCHILGIQPSPHNGTWSEVEGMLINKTIQKSIQKNWFKSKLHNVKHWFTSSPLSVSAAIGSIIVLLLAAVLFTRRQCKKKSESKTYVVLTSSDYDDDDNDEEEEL